MAVLKILHRVRQRIPMSVIETGLFLAAAVAIDVFLLDGTRYRDFAHHPFWIIVLLTTVQYGTGAGLLSAAAASIVLLAGNVPPQPVSLDRYTWLAGVTRLPLLWFVTAVVLGELRMRQRKEHAASLKELEASTQREKQLTEAYSRLSDVRQTLEARVAGQLKTSVSIHEAARGIEKLDPDEVLMGVSALIRAVINPKAFSVFILNSEKLELRLREGWNEDAAWPVFYGPDSQLFREIVGARRFLCRSNRSDEILLRNHGILAGPLLASDSQVIGMLKIENLGFLDLNFSNVQTFRAACEWIGRAYVNAVRYQQAAADSVSSGETDLLSFVFLGRQTQLFTKLAQRIGFDVTMLVIEVANYESIPAAERQAMVAGVSRCMTQALRTTDLAFDYRRTGAEFAVILPGTPADQVQIVTQKLNRALAAEFQDVDVPPVFVHRIQVLHEQNSPAGATA
jgi:GGDEF domain-containing protein